MRLLTVVMALIGLVAFGQSAADAVYAEGKSFYDAKQYHQALTRFDEAAQLEPSKARWQYNRGLALKKLGRDAEARQAFNESLRLDPTYKVSEIREKLADLDGPSSPSPGGGSSGTGASVIGLLSCLAGAVIPVTLLFLVIRAVLGRSGSGGARPQGRMRQAPPVSPELLQRANAVLAAVGPRLTQLEHGMSLGEDPEARRELDRANTNFQLVRRELAKESPDMAFIDGALGRTAEGVAAVEARLDTVHGPAWRQAKGPAAGCFFCARPLTSAAVQQTVGLKLRAQQATVQACPACARVAASGQSPKVATVHGQHWAAMSGIDPYVFTYSSVAAPESVPAWQLGRSAGSAAELAKLAGAAGLGLAAGAVGAWVLDLDAEGASAAASEAAAAAARSASSRQSSSRDWRDNS